MLPIVSISTRNARQALCRAAAVAAKLRELAPYALIEVILPGGSLMALLLWLYRRRRHFPAFVTHEILWRSRGGYSVIVAPAIR